MSRLAAPGFSRLKAPSYSSSRLPQVASITGIAAPQIRPTLKKPSNSVIPIVNPSSQQKAVKDAQPSAHRGSSNVSAKSLSTNQNIQHGTGPYDRAKPQTSSIPYVGKKRPSGVLKVPDNRTFTGKSNLTNGTLKQSDSCMVDPKVTRKKIVPSSKSKTENGTFAMPKPIKRTSLPVAKSLENINLPNIDTNTPRRKTISDTSRVGSKRGLSKKTDTSSIRPRSSNSANKSKESETKNLKPGTNQKRKSLSKSLQNLPISATRRSLELEKEQLVRKSGSHDNLLSKSGSHDDLLNYPKKAETTDKKPAVCIPRSKTGAPAKFGFGFKATVRPRASSQSNKLIATTISTPHQAVHNLQKFDDQKLSPIVSSDGPDIHSLDTTSNANSNATSNVQVARSKTLEATFDLSHGSAAWMDDTYDINGLNTSDENTSAEMIEKYIGEDNIEKINSPINETINVDHNETITIVNDLNTTSTIVNDLNTTSTIANDLNTTSTIANDLNATSTIANDLNATSTIANDLNTTTTLNEIHCKYLNKTQVLDKNENEIFSDVIHLDGHTSNLNRTRTIDENITVEFENVKTLNQDVTEELNRTIELNANIAKETNETKKLMIKPKDIFDNGFDETNFLNDTNSTPDHITAVSPWITSELSYDGETSISEDILKVIAALSSNIKSRDVATQSPTTFIYPTCSERQEDTSNKDIVDGNEFVPDENIWLNDEVNQDFLPTDDTASLSQQLDFNEIRSTSSLATEDQCQANFVDNSIFIHDNNFVVNDINDDTECSYKKDTSYIIENSENTSDKNMIDRVFEPDRNILLNHQVDQNFLPTDDHTSSLSHKLDENEIRNTSSLAIENQCEANFIDNSNSIHDNNFEVNDSNDDSECSHKKDTSYIIENSENTSDKNTIDHDFEPDENIWLNDEVDQDFLPTDDTATLSRQLDENEIRNTSRLATENICEVKYADNSNSIHDNNFEVNDIDDDIECSHKKDTSYIIQNSENTSDKNTIDHDFEPDENIWLNDQVNQDFLPNDDAASLSQQLDENEIRSTSSLSNENKCEAKFLDDPNSIHDNNFEVNDINDDNEYSHKKNTSYIIENSENTSDINMNDLEYSHDSGLSATMQELDIIDVKTDLFGNEVFAEVLDEQLSTPLSRYCSHECDRRRCNTTGCIKKGAKLTRSRTYSSNELVTKFRIPKELKCAETIEGDILMDKTTYLHFTNEIKSTKTLLLKLKRTLLEAHCTSPLIKIPSPLKRANSAVEASAIPPLSPRVSQRSPMAVVNPLILPTEDVSTSEKEKESILTSEEEIAFLNDKLQESDCTIKLLQTQLENFQQKEQDIIEENVLLREEYSHLTKRLQKPIVSESSNPEQTQGSLSYVNCIDDFDVVDLDSRLPILQRLYSAESGDTI